MRPIPFLMAFLLFTWSLLQGQVITSFAIPGGETPSFPRSNSVNDVVVSGDTIWSASSKGPSFTSTGGSKWRNLANTSTFDEKGVSAIAIRGNEVWIATAFTTELDNESIQTGHGLHVSLDRGETWRFVSQPVDSGKVDTLVYGRNRIPALAITVPQQNVTFDIALTKNAVWIASWGGMLRTSTDLGKTWQRVILPPDHLNRIAPGDSLKFALSNVTKFFAGDSLYNKDTLRASLNHVMFSVIASDDSTIWVGTANGINRSTDGGISWRKFNHQNQLRGISGNFVVAIREQRWNGKRIVWAATNNATDPDEKRGVSFSDDNGETWGTALLGEFAHNIAFKDSLVYVATDGGMYRSSDFGSTWLRSGTIYDPVNLQRFGSATVYGVATRGDTIWAGGPVGFAYTIDSAGEPFGTTWRIFRTYQPVQATGKTYSYPLPFSPDDEVVRLHYSTEGRTVPVTIRIFDFSMQPVRTLLRNAIRSGNVEHDEIWDGRDDLDRRVANGVYFYRVEVDGSEPMWGKILVIQ